LDIILSKYLIDKVLHSSSNSKVYLATHVQLGVKRVIKEITKNSIYSDNFYMEINILKNIRHSNIPVIYDTYQIEDKYYIIEEYIEGISLWQMISSYGCISESKAVDYGCQITSLIAFLHSNKSNPILFLDLQPRNIIVNNDKLYLIDFGCSMIKNILERDKIFGTIGYAAPEQYYGNEIGKETDVFGIGALLFYMVTASDIQEGMDVLMLKDSISRRFKQIILRCIKDKKEHRYEDANILLQKLKRLKEINLLQINNYDECNDEEPLYISVVGTESKVGTTYIAFQMAKYLQESGYDVVYKENNSSGHMKHFLKMHSECICYGGVFVYDNLKIIPAYDECVDISYSARIVVLDEGVFEKGREYADIAFLVSGSSEWEIQNTKFITEESNIFAGIILNMCNASMHKKIEEYLNLYEELYYFNSAYSMTEKINNSFYDYLLQGVVKSQCAKKTIGKCIVKIKEKIKHRNKWK
jgi:serine/threonine-protein kinase